jgi:hypothetical protein
MEAVSAHGWLDLSCKIGFVRGGEKMKKVVEILEAGGGGGF